VMWLGFFVGLLVTSVLYAGFGNFQAVQAILGGLLGALFARVLRLQATLEQLQRESAIQLRTRSAAEYARETAPAPSRESEQAPAAPAPSDAASAVFAAKAAAVKAPPAAAPIIFEASEPADAIAKPAFHSEVEPVFGMRSVATPPPLPARPSSRPYQEATAPPMPSVPAWLSSWLSFDNWPIKLGVLLLLIGLGSGYRYLEAQGYLRLPIGYRLIGISLLAIAALAFGWRQRQQRASFALSLQGGALGALLITIYAALQQYQLISGGLAFSLMLAVVATGVVLALLQDALWLALFAALGGFLAPILASTGGGNHVQLFTYYLILNTGILAIALRKGWRALNVLGAIATFGIGLLWGARLYQPEHLMTVTPFLLAFFLMYLAITVLYALRHGEGEAVFDAVLVFGVPLATLSALFGLLQHNRPAIGWFCVCAALLYAVLRHLLQRRSSADVLQQGFLILALSFATLAIPLLFNARITSVLWALEGAGAIWLGLKQNRAGPVFIGYALQAFAALYFLDRFRFDAALSFFNVQYAGALVIALAAWISSYFLDQKQRGVEAVSLLLWGAAWWFGIHLVQIVEFAPERLMLALAIVCVAASIMLFAVLQDWLRWPRPMLLAVLAIMTLPLWVASLVLFERPLLHGRGLALALFFVASLYALHQQRDDQSSVRNRLHALLLLSASLLISIVLHARLPVGASDSLRFAVVVLPFVALAWASYRPLAAIAWPLSQHFSDWAPGLLRVLLVLLYLLCFYACGLMGEATPLRFVPIVNPLEITQLLILWLLWRVVRSHSQAAAAHASEQVQILQRALYLLTFFVLSAITLRLQAYFFAPSASMLAAFSSQSGQAALSIVWSLLGCGAMLLGNARARRSLWVAGASLMGLVLIKLLLIDRQHLGDLPGIIAVLGVGALLAAVGYFAPAPPAQSASAG
jgi:uncharacterized membrane protein